MERTIDSAQPMARQRYSLASLQLWTTPLLAIFLAMVFGGRLLWILQFSLADSLYSGALLVPIISIGLVYLNRVRIEGESGSAAGLILVAASLGSTIALDASQVLLRSATPVLMVLAISGIIVVGWGWQGLRVLAFPVLFLLFLVPIPPALRTMIDFPLQKVCAQVTAGLAHLAGIQVQRSGAMLLFADPTLGVDIAPACNGLRSAVALAMAAVLYVYLVHGHWSRKVAFLAAVLPVAFMANFVRLFGIVCFLGWGNSTLSTYEPAFDHAIGAVLVVVGLIVLFAWARVLGCSQMRNLG